jgi:DNA mismatch endonuclease (patch repair protein)
METPDASSSSALLRMRRQRGRDTKPELALRSILHRRGLRFRVDQPVGGLRRRADVVFSRAQVAVFVDGCFWHGCPTHGTWPKQNSDWWREKIETNRKRDADTDRRLSAAGWVVVRLWEHEDPNVGADAVERLVRRRLSGSKVHHDSGRDRIAQDSSPS